MARSLRKMPEPSVGMGLLTVRIKQRVASQLFSQLKHSAGAVLNSGQASDQGESQVKDL